jgi:hypothetical protein
MVRSQSRAKGALQLRAAVPVLIQFPAAWAVRGLAGSGEWAWARSVHQLHAQHRRGSAGVGLEAAQEQARGQQIGQEVLLPQVGYVLCVLQAQTFGRCSASGAAGLPWVDSSRCQMWACRIMAGILNACVVAGAVNALRALLEAIGTERAQFYRPHDLRRGHAEDLRLSGDVPVPQMCGCALLGVLRRTTLEDSGCG